MSTESSCEFREMAEGVSSKILPVDQNMAGLKNTFQNVAKVANVSFTNGFGVSSVRNDPSMVAANALSNDLREISGVHPKLPQQSGVSELFGGAFNLVKDVAQALKGQEPANIPEVPDLLMRPAPVMAFLPSAPSIG